jgi:hypothetical protein
MAILEKIDDIKLQSISRLGYFLGSFDPLHLGHIEVVKIILNNNLCDAIFIYCVRGKSSYKKRSDFFSRTKLCEDFFGNQENVIVSYLTTKEIQQRFTIFQNGLGILKFEKMSITGIIGSDIAIALEHHNENEELEKARILRQKDFMRGYIISDDSDSVSCSIALPASDFIVALRNDHAICYIPETICTRKVRAIVDMHRFRFISSSMLRK